jgi:predicted RNA-binding protein with PIN domain
VTWWVIDGNNVMGAGADGWWTDPVAAAGRLAQLVAAWANDQDGPVTLVFDGKPEPSVHEAAGGNLEILFATRAGRDAADDRIVAVVEERYAEHPETTVATSDKGLADRLPAGVSREGAGVFRDRIGAPRRVHPTSKRRGGR